MLLVLEVQQISTIEASDDWNLDHFEAKITGHMGGCPCSMMQCAQCWDNVVVPPLKKCDVWASKSAMCE
jgi:hypothetical protein